ncbi:MAG: class B sortase [Christensenellaceae bacterium]
MDNKVQKKKKQNRIKEFLWKYKKYLLISLIIAGIAVAAWNITGYVYNQWVAEKEAQKVLELAQSATPSPSLEPTPTVTPTPMPTRKPPDRYIDFVKLQKENPEIIAWVSIPETKVDYAVVQGKDNIYYLDHDALLQKNIEGAIFMDVANKSDFTDRNTVLYGHRMNNGNMFAGLHDFADADFFAQHKALKLYFPNDIMYEYEIFAAYEAGDDHILSSWDFSDDVQWEKYLTQIGTADKKANIDRSAVGKDDKILTLSTCVRGEDSRRYLLQAVLKTETSTEKKQGGDVVQ